MHAVEDEHGDERADRADQRPRRRPHQREGGEHRELRERVKGDVDADRAVDELDHPPRQRRQLVVAELPLAPVGQRFDEIERQIGIDQRRQRRPNQEMQDEERAEGRLRAALDAGDQSRHRRVSSLRLRRFIATL